MKENLFLKAQYIVLFIIFLLPFLLLCYFFVTLMKEENHSLRQALSDLREYSSASKYIETFYGFLLLIFYLGGIFGPLISVFHAALKEDFEVGCFTLSFVFCTASILYGVFLTTWALIDSFMIKQEVLNNKKLNIFHKQREYKYPSERKIERVFIVLTIILTLGNIIYHFFSFFVSACDEESYESEKKVYLFSIFICFILLNFALIFRNHIYGKYDDSSDQYFFVLMSISCLFFLSILICVLHKLLNVGKISKEAFFSVVLFSPLWPILVIIGALISDVLADDFKVSYSDEGYRKTIGRNKISYLARESDDPQFKVDSLKWKQNEKNPRQLELTK